MYSFKFQPIINFFMKHVFLKKKIKKKKLFSYFIILFKVKLLVIRIQYLQEMLLTFFFSLLKFIGW